MFMKALSFLRFDYSKLLVLVALVLMTMLVVVSREATSKVSWEQMRGIPFPFLVITEYRGPCQPLNTFCIDLFFQRIYPIELLKDILIWYVVSCAMVLGYEVLKKQRRR